MENKRNRSKYIYVLVLSLLVMTTASVQAQSLSSLIKGVAENVTGVGSSLDITGTWNYEGCTVELESSNVVKKIGGKVASSTIEKNVNTQLEKVGFKAGDTTFTFSADSTFTNTTKSKTMKGTYSYDKKTEYLTLKYASKVPVKLKVSGSGSDISFLFEVDELLSVINFIGNNAGSSSLKSLTSLLNSYDGMMVGLNMKKK